MAYDGQLSKNDPFELSFPDVLLPFGLRMVNRLTGMFEKNNSSSEDIHRMAMGLDERLEHYAKLVLDQPVLRQKLTDGLFSQDDRRLLLSATTTEQVRYAATDRVIFMVMKCDHPHDKEVWEEGRRLISPEFDATLAMWKMVDAIELLSAGRMSVKRLCQANRFAMEAMESGYFAFAMEKVANAADVLSEGSEIEKKVRGRLVELVVGSFKKDASERSRNAANKRAERYARSKAEVLRLVEVGGYAKQHQAVKDIAAIINGDDPSVPDKIKESTVKSHLSKAGWSFVADK